jgi:hypothetical protein
MARRRLGTKRSRIQKFRTALSSESTIRAEWSTTDTAPWFEDPSSQGDCSGSGRGGVETSIICWAISGRTALFSEYKIRAERSTADTDPWFADPSSQGDRSGSGRGGVETSIVCWAISWFEGRGDSAHLALCSHCLLAVGEFHTHMSKPTMRLGHQQATVLTQFVLQIGIDRGDRPDFRTTTP